MLSALVSSLSLFRQFIESQMQFMFIWPITFLTVTLRQNSYVSETGQIILSQGLQVLEGYVTHSNKQHGPVNIRPEINACRDMEESSLSGWDS
jgi:hypothetical protein